MSRLELFLYPGCRFTKNYNERCSFEKPTGSNYSVLDTYLNGLDYERFELQNVYYENDMEIVIEREYIKDPYIFNYMKVIEYDDDDHKVLTRFCFINKIECKNGLAYINFEEDIWNSYAPVIWGSAPCLLTASRFKSTDYFSFETLELPIKYDGNNTLNINTISNIYTGKVSVIVEVQSYELTAQDKVSNRDFSYFVAGNRRYENLQPIPVNRDDVSDTIQNAIATINAYIGNMATEMISKYPYQTAKHYEIGNIYIIPSSLIETDLIDTDINNEYSISGIASAGGTLVKLFKFKTNYYNSINFIYEENIVNNYKNYSLGTLSNQVPVVNNGTDMPIKISMSFCDNSFSLKLHYNNNIIDITEDFYYDAPYEMLRSEEFYQRKMSLRMKNLNYDYEFFERMIGAVGYDQNKIAGGVGQAFASKSYSGMIGGIEKAVGGAFDTIKDLVGAFKVNQEKAIANSAMYSATKGLFKNTVHFLNYLTGIVILSINPDNEYYVKNAVDNLGFKVAKFLSLGYHIQGVINGGYLFAIRNNAFYNVIKFEGISVFGDFSSEIAQQLNAILESGIKIWYDPNFLPLDTYTNDLVS